MFDPQIWAQVPFHFWSVVFFVFGSMVGSLLNVCIYRMPRGESIVMPGSHCPHCQYAIPWYLNLPLFTWLWLRGKCRNCREPIAVRYFLVELLTGLAFLTCWLTFGERSAPLALVYGVVLAGLIAATFIDLEHLIIPDEITMGGAVAGFLCSLAVPALHQATAAAPSLRASLLGIGVGAGLIYGILRLGKLLFGRQRFALEPGTRLIFTETALKFPDQEIPYGEMLYRDSDVILFHATQIELPDRCYFNQEVRLSAKELAIAEDRFKPEEIPHMEAVTTQITIPREAMGLGDVKFMAAIGAFLGWQAALFSLLASAILGSLVGVTSILCKRHEWSSRIPYGPYIALAAVIWMFLPPPVQEFWRGYLGLMGDVFAGRPLL